MKLTIRVIAILVAGILGCSDGPTEIDDFLPTFSNQWHNVADETHTFALASADDNKATGTFDGTETLNGVESDVFGTFTNSICEFSIARASGTVTYSGKFLHSDTLRLTRSQETLVIARNQ